MFPGAVATLNFPLIWGYLLDTGGDLMNLLVEFWRLLDRSQRRKLLLLQLLSVAMALSTVGGIAAVLPFFTVLADPSETTRQPLLHRLHEMLPAAGEREFIIELASVSLP
jgi:hypothetical protein